MPEHDLKQSLFVYKYRQVENNKYGTSNNMMVNLL